MINQISFLGLVVKDVPSATTFYTETLGLGVNSSKSTPDGHTLRLYQPAAA